MCTVKLRPHHGLCMTFFEGKGYSSAFIKNMKYLVEHLKSDDQIEIVFEADAVCSCCPNCIEETCLSHAKVERYDYAVAKMCGLSEKMLLTYGEFHLLVENNILKTNNLQYVCNDCGWFSICHNSLYTVN